MHNLPMPIASSCNLQIVNLNDNAGLQTVINDAVYFLLLKK
jgi:hypothetical protein